MPDSGKTARAQLLAISAVVCCLIVCLSIVYITDNSGGTNLALFVTPLLTFGGTVIALLGTLGPLAKKVEATKDRMEAVDEKVDYLANGGTDAKVRAGIADVVKDEFLKDDAEDQLQADRAHRDASPANGANARTPELEESNRPAHGARGHHRA